MSNNVNNNFKSRLCVWRKIMKFTTFLKVFAISLAVFVGATGIGIGILAIAGFFNKPIVQPENMVFDQSEYNVDGDFQITISTQTEDVTQTTLTLSLPYSTNTQVRDGRISDGVISIPQTATLNQPFDVIVIRNTNDQECDGLSWIAGGHSTIRATSENLQINSIEANVNVDVPVYRTELQTKVSVQDEDSDIFAVGSTIEASLKFYPARSAYRYSQDGSNGGGIVYKNTYFMPASPNYENITQINNSNRFTANNVSSGSTLVGYVFTTARIEERILLRYADLEENARYQEILRELEQLSQDSPSSTKQAHRASKSVDIVEVEVDSMQVNGFMTNANIDTEFTLYANKTITSNATQANLGIRLFSSLDDSISLQNELKNVGITFLYRVSGVYYDAVNNPNSLYNVITIPEYGYSQTRQITVDGVDYTYYFPIITESVDDYFWQFAANSFVDADNLCIEIRYFGDQEVEPIRIHFSTNRINESQITWSTSQLDLTIIDGQTPDFRSLDVSAYANVPSTNLYQSRRYFVISRQDINISDYIVTAGEATEYTLGSQPYTLYEIENGIIQPKTTQCYGMTFEVVFVTIQTYYNGSPKYDDGKYIIQMFSQTSLGSISTLEVNIDKTLYGLTSNLQTALPEEELIINGNDIAYVQNQTAPFEIVVGYTYPNNAATDVMQNEQLIFRNAIANDEISIVAKVDGVTTNLIYSTSHTEQDGDVAGTIEYIFSMNIAELASGFRRVKLYVVYQNDALDQPVEIPISTYNDNIALDCIEVYDGAAELFKFNLNNHEEYLTGPDNRINISTEITYNDSGNANYATGITTRYMLANTDIAQYLFQSQDGIIDYTRLSVLVQDKYGKLPISSEYTLESSDSSILVVSNQTFTFNGEGDVEVYLKDANGDVKDTLYFTIQRSGNVSKVEHLRENVVGDVATKVSNVAYDYATSTSSYTFPQISVPLIGYKGSTIYLNSTNANIVNLISYTYNYNNVDILLTRLIRFSLVNSEDEITYGDYVNFHLNNTTAYLEFAKDFGQAQSIHILATVPELGISQVIVLDISPNIDITFEEIQNQRGEDYIGDQIYIGAYADSAYHVRITLNYIIGGSTQDFELDDSIFSLYLYKDGTGQLMTFNQNADNGYIASFVNSKNSEDVNTNAISRGDANTSNYVYDIYIVFKSLSEGDGFNRLIVSLEKNQNHNYSIDNSASLYLNINPNIQLNQSSNDLYLNVAYENLGNHYAYGEALLFSPTDENSPIEIDRVVQNNDSNITISDIDYSLVEFEITRGESSFEINKVGTNEFYLRSISNIHNSSKFSANVTYNGVVIGSVEFDVYPNIVRNDETNLWVKYKGEYYLKLVNGEQYSFAAIVNAFRVNKVNPDDSSISVSFEMVGSQYLTIDDNNSLITIQNVINNIVIADQGTLRLSNGDSISFNVILLPFDVPFVLYPNVDVSSYDLYDLLDAQYLIANNMYFTLEGAGNDEGTDILFTLDQENDENTYGIKYVSGMILSVRNVNTQDNNIYAYFDMNGAKPILKTEAVGQDTFVIVEARLSMASNSLVIPYLIMIKAELSLRTYYPYVEGHSQNGNISGNDLITSLENVSFDMEYLNFDQDGKAQLDLFARFDNILLPNYSNSSRFVIGKLNSEGVFEPNDNSDLTLSSSIVVTISELWYYYYGWENAQNVQNYATITSNINGNGLLTVNKNGASYLRIKLTLTTRSGLIAYYYVSVGEIPAFTLTQRQADDTFSTQITNISFKAGTEFGLAGRYRLSSPLGQSSGVTDVTNLLKFYSPAELDDVHVLFINDQTQTLEAQSSTENWSTDLVLYTKYGPLVSITVDILSNYNIGLVEGQNVVTYNSSGYYEVLSGNVIDVLSTFKINKDDEPAFEPLNIDVEITLDDDIDSTKLYLGGENNQSIFIGLFTQTTMTTINIRFNFQDEGNDAVYNFTLNLNIISALTVAQLAGQSISQNNMLSVGGIVAGQNGQEIDVLISSIEDGLFNFNSHNGITFDSWYKNVLGRGLGELRVELLSQNVYGSFSGDIINNGTDDTPNYVIGLNISEVATSTDLSFRVSFYSSGGDMILSSYFMLSVEPNFRVVTNYPSPNDSTAVVAESYYWVAGENNTINLQEAHELANQLRVQVLSLDGSESTQYATNINVYPSTGSEFITVGGQQFTQGQPLDTTFEINNIEETFTTIVFELRYVNGSVSIPIGVYNLVILQSDIYSMSGYNYNTTSNQNSLNNRENIYIGDNDNILNTITASFIVPTDLNLEVDKYLEITQINGVQVQASMVTLQQGMQGTTQSVRVLLLGDLSNFGRAEFNVQFSIYELNTSGEYIPSNLYDEDGNILPSSEISFTFQSRIRVMYRAVTSLNDTQPQFSDAQVEFFKQYLLIDINASNLVVGQIQNEGEIDQPISLQNGREIGTYYVNYDFDIQFDQTTIELTTGQNTNVLYTTSQAPNFRSVINMKRASNGSYYTQSDFSNGGLQLRIDSADVTNIPTDFTYGSDAYNDFMSGSASRLSYLTFTPFMSEDGTIYDYNFMAQGSPKETRVTVTIPLTIVFGAIEKEYTLTFIVKHDYNESTLTLRNADNSINSQTSRNRIQSFDSFITFATWGSTSPFDNFIFIEHTNESQNEPGNIASLFNVTYEQNGSYVEKLPQSSSNYNLSFKFTDVMFNDINIDIKLTDDYGYSVMYYVTIVARYNINYTLSNINVFEDDSVAVFGGNNISNSPYNQTIPITFQKRNSAYNDITIGDLGEWSAQFVANYNYDINEDGYINDADSYNVDYSLISQGNYRYFITEFAQAKYFTQTGMISGTLKLKSTYSDSNGTQYDISFEIPMNVRERYSLQASSTPYVRDGVAFSLLDVVDVVDNSKNYAVAQRELTDSYTIYLDYSILDESLSEIQADLSSFVTLGIRAYNTQNQGYVDMSLANVERQQYVSLTELFGIDDIQNYEFTWICYYTEYNFEGDEVISSEAKRETFTYTNNGNSVPYVISLENSDGYQLSSNAITFKTSDNKTYQIKIDSSYIIEDQTFTIGLRELDNDQRISVWFVDTEDSANTKVLNVVSNTNSQVTYSLREQGITSVSEKVSLYTSQDKTIVNGLSNSDIAKLKGISFESVSGGDTIESNYQLTKYIEPNPDGTVTFKTSNDGLNVEYVDGEINIKVNYAIVDGEPKKTEDNFRADIWITPKFISVDSTLAYGSGVTKNVLLPDGVGIGSPISLSTWAGTTYRQFELISGYTSATSFVDSDDSTFSANVDDLYFAINTLQSQEGASYASIDSQSGAITLSDEFNYQYHYLIIDVFVKYGEDQSRTKQIGSVRIQFTPSSSTSFTVSAPVKQLPYTSSDNSVTIKSIDILQMLRVSDNISNTYQGTDILDVFPSITVLFYSSRTGNSEDGYIYTPISSEISPETTEDVTFTMSTIQPVNLRVRLTSDGEDKVIEDIELVNDKYTANSLASSSAYSYLDVSNAGESAIFAAIYDKIRVRNIYGNLDNADTVFDIEGNYDYNDLKDSGKITHLAETKSSLVTTHTFTLGDNLNSDGIVYGKISVDVYTEPNEITDNLKLEMTVGDSQSDLFRNELFCYESFPVHGYMTKSTPGTDGADPLTEYYLRLPIDSGNEIAVANAISNNYFDIYQNGSLLENAQSNAFTLALEAGNHILFTFNAATGETVPNLSGYDNDMFVLVFKDSNESTANIVYSTAFVFKNQSEETDSRISEFENIFQLLSYMYGLDQSSLYVRLTDETNSVVLRTENGNYSLFAIKQGALISVKLEIYISITDVNSGVEDIVLYSNDISITISQPQIQG